MTYLQRKKRALLIGTHQPKGVLTEAEGTPLRLPDCSGDPLYDYRVFGPSSETILVCSSGKNVMPFRNGRWELEGITVEVTDGLFRVFGTANRGVAYDLVGQYLYRGTVESAFPASNYLFPGTYTLSMHDAAGTGSSFFPYVAMRTAEGGSGQVGFTNSGSSVTLNGQINKLCIYVSSGNTVAFEFRIQLERGAVKTAYEPYAGMHQSSIVLPTPLLDGEWADYRRRAVVAKGGVQTVALPRIRTVRGDCILETNANGMWGRYWKE